MDNIDADFSPLKRFFKKSLSQLPLNYEELYKHCDGLILEHRDCGLLCGNASCCHSKGVDGYIYFLPEEREYHKALKNRISFKQVIVNGNLRHYCEGNAGCVNVT